MEFNIVENKTLNYEEVKQAYLNGVRGNQLRKMFNFGTSQYTTLMKRLREDGIYVPKHGNIRPNNQPKNYHKIVSHNGNEYWQVTKTIKWKKHYFGSYKTEEEAKARVEYLRENNWEGVFDD